MKAVLCKAYGPPDNLVLEDIASPQPKKGQVLISVKACALNFPDTLIIQGKYQFKPPMPFSPGSDVAGIVKEVGEGVESFKAGDNVFAFAGWGGFAEEVAADASKTIPIPTVSISPPLPPSPSFMAHLTTRSRIEHTLKQTKHCSCWARQEA